MNLFEKNSKIADLVLYEEKKQLIKNMHFWNELSSLSESV